MDSEAVNEMSAIQHPAVRTGLQARGYDDSKGVELLGHGDLPARSRTGSGSAIAVGLMNVLNTLRDKVLNALAVVTRDLEQTDCAAAWAARTRSSAPTHRMSATCRARSQQS